MSQIINGNKVFLDKVRGRWTVLFTKEQLRKQYGNEAEAIAAAEAGTPGNLPAKDTSGTTIPKQSIDTELSKKSNAVEKAKEQVKSSVEQRAALEGSTISTEVDTEKDGFVSMTAATTKGATAEGPSIAKMTGNINEGNITVNVQNSNKLAGVTGSTKGGAGVVLNETIVQGNVKGMAQALTKVAGVSTKDVQTALPTASPIPSLAAVAMRTELTQGGIAANAGAQAQEACAAVSREIKNPFGSDNLFGGIGGGFGNILGQIASMALNLSTGYKDPRSLLKASSQVTVLNRSNVKVPTPNIINGGGPTNQLATTNLKGSVIKSKLEDNSLPSENNVVEATGGIKNWKGILTDSLDLSGRENVIEEDARQQAEISQIDREIRQVIVGGLPELKKHYTLLEVHLGHQKNMIRDFGAETINANPNDYALPCHVFIEFSGLPHMYRPFNEEVKLQNGNVPARPGAFYIYIGVSGSGGNKSKYGFDQTALAKFLNNFLIFYPGVEILGVDDVNPDCSYKPNPYFDVRDFVNSSLRKPSTFPKNEIVECPPAADLAVRRPVNVVVPKRNPNTLPNVNQLVVQKNQTIKDLSPTQYLNLEDTALSFVKQKKDAILGGTNLEIGTGKLGVSLGKVARLDNVAKTAYAEGQAFKLDKLKAGKILNTVKGIFE